jgi:hypothetical protein
MDPAKSGAGPMETSWFAGCTVRGRRTGPEAATRPLGLAISALAPLVSTLAVDKKGVDPLVDVPAQLWEMPDKPGRHAADPGLLDYGDQCLLSGLVSIGAEV